MDVGLLLVARAGDAVEDEEVADDGGGCEENHVAGAEDCVGNEEECDESADECDCDRGESDELHWVLLGFRGDCEGDEGGGTVDGGFHFACSSCVLSSWLVGFSVSVHWGGWQVVVWVMLARGLPRNFACGLG